MNSEGFMRNLCMRGLAALLAVSAMGCTSLLPSTHSEEPSGFNTYEAARTALDQVQPYQTSVDELGRLGFQVNSSTNLELVPYPQWVGLLIGQNVPLDQADVGIRDCLAARAGCQAYVFRFSRLTSERRGSFLADFLNFKRNTYVHGWRFEGTMLVRDKVVLFRNHRGQAKIDLYEDRSNPLGPFQSMGESAASRLPPLR